MTTEQQLQAIIEAQVRGGFSRNAGADIITVSETTGGVILTFNEGQSLHHILEILLDPAGLKAAYEMLGIGGYKGRPVLAKTAVAHDILDTWLSSGGDAAKTIQTAFDLLP